MYGRYKLISIYMCNLSGHITYVQSSGVQSWYFIAQLSFLAMFLAYTMCFSVAM